MSVSPGWADVKHEDQNTRILEVRVNVLSAVIRTVYGHDGHGIEVGIGRMYRGEAQENHEGRA